MPNGGFAEILKQYPQLFRYGFSTKTQTSFSDQDFELAERVADWLKSRISRAAKIQESINSYNMKHIAEKDMHEYVPNGVLILAALRCGFSMKRCPEHGNPNVYFDMSSKDWKVLRRGLQKFA
jgi:hypothetical protein